MVAGAPGVHASGDSWSQVQGHTQDKGGEPLHIENQETVQEGDLILLTAIQKITVFTFCF